MVKKKKKKKRDGETKSNSILNSNINQTQSKEIKKT
jgi:hypothetical protein